MTVHFSRLSRISHTLLVTVVLVMLAASCARASVPAVAPERLEIHTGRNALLLPYRTSHDLSEQHDEVRRVVVMVHGTLRNADVYHQLAMSAVRSAGKTHETLVIAPQFLMERDLNEHRPGGNVLFWSNAGWKQGDDSRSTLRHPRTARLSSYEAMERLLEHVFRSGSVPNLREIVIAGHSAGGQFVNRFAAGSRFVDEIAEAGIDVHFIVSNPSSYVYFCDARWCNTEEQFLAYAPHRGNGRCAAFSGYKYGMQGLNRFMRQKGREGLRAAYSSRRVTYLLGERDNDPNARFLDIRCPAMLQGAHRLERGERYFEYLGWRLGEDVYDLHTKYVVSNVGHNARRIFVSDEGREALFGDHAMEKRISAHSPEGQPATE